MKTKELGHSSSGRMLAYHVKTLCPIPSTTLKNKTKQKTPEMRVS
jgi:hypothetical protein